MNWGIFLDDRVAWTDNFKDFEKAAQVAYRFDTMCAFKWNESKGASFALRNGDRRRLRRASCTMGPVKREVVNLGITYSTISKKIINGTKVVRQKAATKAYTQIRRIAKACRFNTARRWKLAHKLALPKMAWGGQWQAPPARVTRRWATEIERCVLGKIIPGRSRALVWTLKLGASLDPQYAMDLAALRCHRQRLWKRALWLRRDPQLPPRREPVTAKSRVQEVARKWGCSFLMRVS